VTLEATAAGSMRAIVQDGYGPADVLRLARMARPEIAGSEVVTGMGRHAGRSPSPSNWMQIEEQSPAGAY
jgi:hypothetical protein